VAPVKHAAASSAATPAERMPAEALPHSSKETAPIMPDDGKKNVHAEDFLPFFQFPEPGDLGVNSSTAPNAAAPARNPPSTATYRVQ